MENVLITGGTGFVGKWLSQYLSNKYNVYISSRTKNYKNIIQLDLKDIIKTKEILKKYKFKTIFHLTAQTSVKISWALPFDTLYDNINATLNLLKAVNELESNTKIILASTSEVYKVTDNELTEDSDFDPKNPYSISKIVIDYLVRNISKKFEINCTILRLFNHTGPIQSTTFVLGSFSKQIAEIKLGLRPPVVKVGNLEARRDFVDVRDVCRAYELVSNDISYGEVYNVCSGNEYVIRDLLDRLISISGVDVKIEIDPERMRPSDVPTFYGSYKKIYDKFGWEPKISIDETLNDMIDYWVENLKS